MKMHNSAIEKAAGVKDVRHYLTQPYLDVERGAILATNGQILAVVPVDLDEDDTSGHVSIDAIKAARKQAPGSRADKVLSIKANGGLLLQDGQSYPRGDLGKYPDIDRVIPDKDKAEHVFSIDATLLKNLAEAICEPGNSQVTLYLNDSNGGIYVEPNQDDSKAHGVIMPCRGRDES